MLDKIATETDRGAFERPDLEPARLTIQHDPQCESGNLARFNRAVDPATALLAWFGDDFVGIAETLGTSGLRQILDRDIADLDDRIMHQLDAILSHPEIRKLEATWRGILYLLEAAENDTRVKVRILPATWAEMAKDFDKALEFDQSALFAKIYNEEFGMAGGLPYGLLLCDHAVRPKPDASHRIDDIGVMASLSQVAAAAFAPCLLGASPQLLGVDDFADLATTQDVASVFRAADYRRWQSLQRRADSRFLAVVMPRVLLRKAWGDDGGREDGFRFRDGDFGLGTRSWLWGSGIYALGAVTIRAFRDWGWFADIRGTRVDLEEAGLVTGLPSPTFSTGENIAFRRPVEVEFTDRKQRSLEECGLIALSPCRLTPYLAVLGAPSMLVPEAATSAIVDANERLSAMLPYVLCASRFAHYVKVIARERIGAYTTCEALQDELHKWINQYTIGNADAAFEIKARYPLSGGRVEVQDLPGRPGSYSCTIQLTPHFQIDQVVAAFRFQTEIRTSRTP